MWMWTLVLRNKTSGRPKEQIVFDVNLTRSVTKFITRYDLGPRHCSVSPAGFPDGTPSKPSTRLLAAKKKALLVGGASHLMKTLHGHRQCFRPRYLPCLSGGQTAECYRVLPVTWLASVICFGGIIPFFCVSRLSHEPRFESRICVNFTYQSKNDEVEGSMRDLAL